MITVALVHYETPELAAACVASVRRFPPAERYEVVVVDNASSRSARIALGQLRGVRVIDSGRNGGFAFGVNCCFEEADASSDVIVVMNPDTEVRDEASIDRLVFGARAAGTSLAAPSLLNREGKRERSFHRRVPSLALVPVLVSAPVGLLADRIARAFNRHPSELSEAEIRKGASPAHVMGAVMAISRRAWRTVGPFDERFFLYLEETDWQVRAASHGLTVKAVLDAEFMHLHRGGALEGAVPSSAYLESLRKFLVASGSHPKAVDALIELSLLSSIFAFSLFRAVVCVAFRDRRPLAVAGLSSASTALKSRRRARGRAAL